MLKVAENARYGHNLGTQESCLTDRCHNYSDAFVAIESEAEFFWSSGSELLLGEEGLASTRK
jgi:hypothetical protein